MSPVLCPDCERDRADGHTLADCLATLKRERDEAVAHVGRLVGENTRLHGRIEDIGRVVARLDGEVESHVALRKSWKAERDVLRGSLVEIAAAAGVDVTKTPAGIVAGTRAAVVLLRQLVENERALAEHYRRDAARLRADFPPAPPLPTMDCTCRTCGHLREQQIDRASKRAGGTP